LYFTDNEQYRALVTCGVKIAEHYEVGYTHILYQLNGFYVEGKVDGCGEVRSIVSFSSTEGLDKYLGKIDYPKTI
jgi:hypothetical protein